ncbi:hypothetical protein PHMEG_00036984 [Phytophthora megakarya]|uniref:Secreted protein n=1 Tax=Phytophthora megakarya TaxID=4795 RepID=A0A225UKU7_9STRA|nr:hypothetical protein PHMEG_00036984 [Phytophthora megakarya]
MKVLIVLAALAALLTPIQCAGVDPSFNGAIGKGYESSGSLTTDWTQKACAAAGGSIDPNKKGNQKCCNAPDSNLGAFSRTCAEQTDPKYRFANWSCKNVGV